MRRDPELIRNILLQIEATPAGETPGLMCEDRSYAEIFEHVVLLVDAGFIEAHMPADYTSCEPRGFKILRMTWAGQEFLSKAKNDTLWKKVMAQAQEKGMSTSLSIINSLLEAAAKKYVGLE